jgi:hypothetical protein
MIWIFVRRDYGALEYENVAGRSPLLKARSQCTQSLMAVIRSVALGSLPAVAAPLSFFGAISERIGEARAF